MKRIYCISGLGADQRVFQKLHIPGAELVPVAWPAFTPDDDMPGYAQKIMAQIQDERPAIIGVSFGGMLAVEIAKQIPVTKVFLVSSAKTADELPQFSGFIRFLFRVNLIPIDLLKKNRRQMFARFGVGSEDSKKLLLSIVNDTDTGFVKWAAGVLLGWENKTIPAGIVHIHGTADKLIPPGRVQPDYWIEGGTHFMIYDRAAEISRIIASQLPE